MTAALSLLGPSARPMVALGGANAWKTREIKGVHCSFQWLDLSASGMEQTNPCMCLYRPRGGDRGAYVIPQQNAFEFGTREGNPTSHLGTSAFAAAEMLGFDLRDKYAIRTIIDIIIEGLPDLILMPSEPPASSDAIIKRAILGIEAQARVNGKTVIQEVL